jgi:hypothetical protein
MQLVHNLHNGLAAKSSTRCFRHNGLGAERRVRKKTAASCIRGVETEGGSESQALPLATKRFPFRRHGKRFAIGVTPFAARASLRSAAIKGPAKIKKGKRFPGSIATRRAPLRHRASRWCPVSRQLINSGYRTMAVRSLAATPVMSPRGATGCSPSRFHSKSTRLPVAG